MPFRTIYRTFEIRCTFLLGFLGAGKYFCLLAKYLTQWPLMAVVS